MTYRLYQLLMILLFPIWILYTQRRCRQQADPSHCWRQLWSWSLPNLPTECIWIHAVSLGETKVALSLIERLRSQYPDLPIFFTCGNRSAISLAQTHCLDNMAVSFLPLDYAWLRRRLFKHLNPRLLLLIETELWPNLLMQAHRYQIPVAIIQARLSQSSKRNYPRYASTLLQQLLAPVAYIAAQTQEDAGWFIRLGANPDITHCAGNLKFDLQLPATLASDAQILRQRLGDDRWIWTAGSTHLGEESILAQAHQQLTTSVTDALLILAPRHLKHIEQVFESCTAQGLSVIRWSDWYGKNEASNDALPPNTHVLLLDVLGELLLAYQVANACFVGGSLIPWGGHNLLEPAALQKPIIAGNYNHNFAEIERSLCDHQAMICVADAPALAAQLLDWYHHPESAQTLAHNAYQVFQSQQGATERILAQLSPFIHHHDPTHSP